MLEVDLDRAADRQAEARPAVGAQLAPQVAGCGEKRVAGLAFPARAGLQLAHLLEGVDAHLRVAADRQAHAGVTVGHRGQVAVAEVAFGRRAGDDDGPCARE